MEGVCEHFSNPDDETFIYNPSVYGPVHGVNCHLSLCVHINDKHNCERHRKWRLLTSILVNVYCKCATFTVPNLSPRKSIAYSRDLCERVLIPISSYSSVTFPIPISTEFPWENGNPEFRIPIHRPPTCRFTCTMIT